MKEILAKIWRFFKRITIKFACLFKLTFRLGDKEDEDEGGSYDS